MSLHGSPAAAAAAAASLLHDLATPYDRSYELCWVLLFIFPSAGICAFTRRIIPWWKRLSHVIKEKKKRAPVLQICRWALNLSPWPPNAKWLVIKQWRRDDGRAVPPPKNRRLKKHFCPFKGRCWRLIYSFFLGKSALFPSISRPIRPIRPLHWKLLLADNCWVKGFCFTFYFFLSVSSLCSRKQF